LPRDLNWQGGIIASFHFSGNKDNKHKRLATENTESTEFFLKGLSALSRQASGRCVACHGNTMTAMIGCATIEKLARRIPWQST
jgi:hypothetical protein